MPVGQVDVDRGEHPSGGLPQPLGVQAAPGPGPCPVALATSHPSACATWTEVASSGACSAALHDHPHLLDPQLPGRERLPGHGVFVLQQPRRSATHRPPAHGSTRSTAPTTHRSRSPRSPRPPAAGRPPPTTPAAAPPPGTPPAPTPRPPRPARRRPRLHRCPTGPRQTRLDMVISSPTPCSATGGSGVRSSTATLIPVWYRTRVRSTTPSAPRCGDPNPTTDPAHQSTHMPMSERPPFMTGRTCYPFARPTLPGRGCSVFVLKWISALSIVNQSSVWAVIVRAGASMRRIFSSCRTLVDQEHSCSPKWELQVHLAVRPSKRSQCGGRCQAPPGRLGGSISTFGGSRGADSTVIA